MGESDVLMEQMQRGLDIHKICISGKIFTFYRDTKYILFNMG